MAAPTEDEPQARQRFLQDGSWTELCPGSWKQNAGLWTVELATVDNRNYNVAVHKYEVRRDFGPLPFATIALARAYAWECYRQVVPV